MVGEKVDLDDARAESSASSSAPQQRDRSTIDFPYLPLESGLEVANALYNRCGTSSCDQDELAAELGQTLSGAFRQKTSAARSFGLVRKDGRSAFVITDLGQRAVSDDTRHDALIEAFLQVPLYGEIYEKFRGKTLPPAKALEREMEALGVAGKQTDRARQAFERSAQFSGFHDSGKDRLVKPRMEGAGPQVDPVADTPSDPQDEGARPPGGGFGGGGGELPPGLDPIIRGLIDRLPASGETWPVAKRKLWLQILENSFDLVYESDDEHNPLDDVL